QVYAEIGGSAHADSNDGWRTGLAACIDDAIDHEALDGGQAFGRDGHAQKGVVLGPAAFGNHLDFKGVGVFDEFGMDDRHARPAGSLIVFSADGMNHARAQRMLARRAFATLAYGLVHSPAIDGYVTTYEHVVNG